MDSFAHWQPFLQLLCLTTEEQGTGMEDTDEADDADATVGGGHQPSVHCHHFPLPRGEEEASTRRPLESLQETERERESTPGAVIPSPSLLTPKIDGRRRRRKRQRRRRGVTFSVSQL